MVSRFENLIPQAAVVIVGSSIWEALPAILENFGILYATARFKVHTAICLLMLLLASAAEHHVLGRSMDVWCKNTCLQKSKVGWWRIIVNIICNRDALEDTEIGKKFISLRDLSLGRLWPWMAWNSDG